MIIERIEKPANVSSKLGFFRFRKLNPAEYVLTNDLGDYLTLRKEDFATLLQGEKPSDEEMANTLEQMGILKRNEYVSAENILRLRNRNMFLFSGTTLHIVVVTLRCDLKCDYCQASAKGSGRSEYDMTEETAQAVVDTIFQSPGRRLDIEFQGGEPLLNWPVVQYIINYANRKALAENKDVYFALVSNLISLTDEQLGFLVENEVGITTSIDGPEALHNLHRGKDTHQKVAANLKKCFEVYKSRYVLRLPGALMTMTRDVLSNPKEIVDEYISLGQEAIQFRKVSPFGMASRRLEQFNFTCEEYLKFYEEAFDYILELNKSGTRFTERTAYLFLLKMFTDHPVNHMDCRNPCGAAIGQMAYHYNGNVYTCDEGRMMAMMGVDDFCLGNVREHTLDQLLDNDVTKAVCVSSCLESIPSCDMCAYKPYCGVCPVYNFAMDGDLFSKEHFNERCRINKGIMDILMERAKDPAVVDIYKSWFYDIYLV